jgi:hypothetical protein
MAQQAKNSGELIVEGWPAGIAPSPLEGFGLFRNVDITTNPGSVRLSYATVDVTGGSTSVSGLVIGMVKNPKNSSQIFALDAAGVLYQSVNGGGSWFTVATTYTAGQGQGIEVWRDCLFVVVNDIVNVYYFLSHGEVWVNSFETFAGAYADSLYHTMLRSIDDTLYICAGQYVSNLSENSGKTFDPTNSATFTFNAAAIPLAQYYRTKCLQDLGQYLAIGTWQGSNPSDIKSADLFMYSRAALTLGIPLQMNENGVNSMLSHDNRLYVQAGLTGKIYECNTTSFTELVQVPNYCCNLDNGAGMFVYPKAMAFHRGKLLFGLSIVSGNPANIGVWSYQLPEPGRKTGALTLDYTISTGNDGSAALLQIGSLLSTANQSLLIGWYDQAGTYQGATTPFGIDQVNVLRVYDLNAQGQYQGIIETELFQVGEAYANRTVQSLEEYLSKELTLNQGVQVWWRKSLSEPWTLLDTFTAVGQLARNVGAATSTGCVFLQLQIRLWAGSQPSGPEMKRIMAKLSL